MDSLIISGLSLNTKIGVFAWEQQIKQKLLLDITIPLSFIDCEEDIRKTLDYDALCKVVTESVESKSYQLIETVANDVAALIKQQFKVEQVTIAVSKPHAVKNAANIQVIAIR